MEILSAKAATNFLAAPEGKQRFFYTEDGCLQPDLLASGGGFVDGGQYLDHIQQNHHTLLAWTPTLPGMASLMYIKPTGTAMLLRELAQQKDSLAGKILRLATDGTVKDNDDKQIALYPAWK